MRKFYQSNDFKKLEEEWTQKLAENGFQDAEKKIAGERVLRQSADYAFRRKEHDQIYREAKLEYFSLLSAKMSTAKFEDQSDRLIMQRTADGKSISEISNELKSLGWKKHNRDTIRYIRRRYETRWGIRHWKPQDMVSRKVLTPSWHSQQLNFLFVIKTSSLRNGNGH